MLLSEGGNERHLCSRVGCRRADLLKLPTQVRSSRLTPFGCGVEVRVVDLLGHKYDVEITPCTARRGASPGARRAPARCQHQQHKNEKTGYQCLKQLFHCHFLSFTLVLNFPRQDADG